MISVTNPCRHILKSGAGCLCKDKTCKMKDIFIKEGIGEKLNEMNGEMEDKKNANQARCYPLDWQAV
jgi:hypothetical protein